MQIVWAAPSGHGRERRNVRGTLAVVKVRQMPGESLGELGAVSEAADRTATGVAQETDAIRGRNNTCDNLNST
jgi:hypothetical protein